MDTSLNIYLEYNLRYWYFSVTLRVEGTNKTNLNFASLTHFCANEEGIVDLSKQPPVEHPDYNEPDSMGIFWSMQPLPKSDTRFWSNNVSEGLFYKFNVYKGTCIFQNKFIINYNIIPWLVYNILFITWLSLRACHGWWHRKE